MNTAYLSGQNIMNCELPEVVKKTSKTSLILGGITILVALGLTFSPLIISGMTYVYLISFIGIVLAGVGIFEIGWRSKRRYYETTKSTIKQTDYYFRMSDLNNLKFAAENDLINFMKNIEACDEGNIKLSIVASKDSNYVAVQVFCYEPFAYLPKSDVIIMKNETAVNFLKAVNQ